MVVDYAGCRVDVSKSVQRRATTPAKLQNNHIASRNTPATLCKLSGVVQSPLRTQRKQNKKHENTRSVACGVGKKMHFEKIIQLIAFSVELSRETVRRG